MFASIRRFDGATSVEDMIRYVDERFLPVIRQAPGFAAYYLLDAGEGAVISISVFQDKTGAEASNALAAKEVQDNLASLLPNPPQITIGEVRVHSVQPTALPV
jgi:hypothetical protein